MVGGRLDDGAHASWGVGERATRPRRALCMCRPRCRRRRCRRPKPTEAAARLAPAHPPSLTDPAHPARPPTRPQGLRGSIPPNFPYLHVEFGLGDGFVHVIDDERKFDRGLARSVLIGARGAGAGLVGAGPRPARECAHRPALCASTGARCQAHSLAPHAPAPAHPRTLTTRLAGLLGLPQEDMHRRARGEAAATQQAWADEFRKEFEPYDWTRMLEA